jgi:hypothetical protein
MSKVAMTRNTRLHGIRPAEPSESVTSERGLTLARGNVPEFVYSRIQSLEESNGTASVIAHSKTLRPEIQPRSDQRERRVLGSLAADGKSIQRCG